MVFNVIIRSTAAFGGAPFRLNKCTALGSAGAGAGAGVFLFLPYHSGGRRVDGAYAGKRR